MPPNAEEGRFASDDVLRRDPSAEHRVEVRVSVGLLRPSADSSRHPFETSADKANRLAPFDDCVRMLELPPACSVNLTPAKPPNIRSRRRHQSFNERVQGRRFDERVAFKVHNSPRRRPILFDGVPRCAKPTVPHRECGDLIVLDHSPHMFRLVVDVPVHRDDPTSAALPQLLLQSAFVMFLPSVTQDDEDG